MKQSGLDAHNKSIDLCLAAFTDIFNTEVDDQSMVREDGHSADVSDFPGFSEGQQVRPCCHTLPTMWTMTNISAYDDTSEYDKVKQKKTLSIEFRGKESGIKEIDIKRSTKPNEVVFDEFGTIASYAFVISDAKALPLEANS